MAMRNQLTRPLTWKIARNPQLASSIKECGWQVAWVWVNIIASVDHYGRMEGSCFTLRDMFFPQMPDIFPENVEKWLVSLENVGLLIRYEGCGSFIQLPKIGVYQKLGGNIAQTSDYPDPPSDKVRAWQEKFSDNYCPLIVKRVKKSPNGQYFDDIEKVGAYWNSKPRLQKINHWNKERQAKVKERLGSSSFRQNWKVAIDKIAGSTFCCGGGKTGWRASFDWFIKNDMNWIKSVEGKYDDRTSNKFEDMLRNM